MIGTIRYILLVESYIFSDEVKCHVPTTADKAMYIYSTTTISRASLCI